MLTLRCQAVFLLVALAGSVQAQDDKRPNVFDLPRLQAVQAAENRASLILLNAGKFAEAETKLLQAVERVPHDINAHYNLACALARQDKADAALDMLEKAVAVGFRNPEHIQADDDLASLRDNERFAAILKSAAEPVKEASGWKYTAQPVEPAEGQVLITEKNVVWDTRLGMFRAFVKFDKDAPQPEPTVGLGKAGELLRRWYKEGTAAGNQADLYDNHDSDHSNMNFRALPQLTRVEFSEAAKKRNLHHGLQRFFRYNAVTIGNSSTALTSGPFWRGQGRLAITQPGGAARLYLHYRANHLYFYPEHRDHDPGHNGRDKKGYGDVFPANTPYLIISQGSSGSDRAFMNAVAQTLAAFHPEVKAKLAKAGMLMPTVQMIFRSSNKMVAKAGDYLTGKAHPTVFDGNQLDVVKMVTMAHDLKPDSLPPLVQLKVVEEDQGVSGRDYFGTVGQQGQPQNEKIFDTPCAIARVARSSKYMRRMVVSAEASQDLDGRPLTYHWAVLRGDAERIRIKPLNESGSIATLLIPYHERQAGNGPAEPASNRVDIGVFVNNGDHYSAPAFISLYYLDNQKRTYDDQHRIQVIDHADATASGNYVDPLLDLRKDWRDEYRYGENGKLLGWTRVRGDNREQFTDDGKLIVETAKEGQPAKTREVRYVVSPVPKKAPVLKQVVVEEK